MKISILLPYKENFSPIYPGAVSLFIKDTLKRIKISMHNKLVVFLSFSRKQKTKTKT